MAGTQYAVDVVFNTAGGQQLKQASVQMNRVEVAAKGASKALTKVENNIRQVNGTFRDANGRLRDAKGRFIKVGDAAKTASSGIKGLSSGIAGLVTKVLALTAATVGFQQTLAATFERGNAEKRLQNLTSSTAEYEQALRLSKIASAEFGFTQTEATQALGDTLSRLKGVGYGLTEVNEIYRGFNVIARQSGVAAADASGAFLQLGQALGSGKLQGDELRSILERMPQLAQAIAAEMGIAAGAVRKAGADGKITGDVMFRALSKAAESSAGLEGKLTKQQATFADLKVESEDLKVALGKAFAPVLLSAVQTLTGYVQLTAKAFENMDKWATENEATIKRVLTVGLEIGKIAATIFIVIKAFQAYKKAVIAVTAAKAALLSLTGVGLVKALGSVAVGVAVYKGLDAAIGGAADSVAKLKAESDKDLKKIKDEAEAVKDQFEGMNNELGKAVDNEKELAAAVQKTTDAINESVEAVERRAEAEASVEASMFDLTQQRLQTEQTINGILLEQANSQLQNAQNQRQREQAAIRIYQLTVQQARLERQAAMAGVAETLRKKEAQLQTLQLKAREIAAEVALARAKGVATEEHQKALDIARGAVELAEQQLGIQEQIAAERVREINAIYDSKQLAAELAFQQNLVADNTQRAASAAGSLAGNMSAAASAASSAASAAASAANAASSGPGGFQLSQGTAAGAGASYQFGGAAASHPHFQAIRDSMEEQHSKRTFATAASANRAYRKMMDELMTISSNYNQRVTAGRAQEARDSWNEVMGGSSSGRAGTGSKAMINVSTGPVMNMNGQNYVSQGDFVQGMQIAAEEGASLALEAIKGSGSTRREAGVG